MKKLVYSSIVLFICENAFAQSSLVLSNGALLDNVEIVMESGATLRVTGYGKIRMRSGIHLNAPLGASVIMESVKIL